MGVKIDEFNVPVCNSFEAKILNDQLCYEVDLQKYSNNIDKEIKLGFYFIMDYNEDRQVTFEENIKKEEMSMASTILESDHNEHAFIYLNTIGQLFTI